MNTADHNSSGGDAVATADTPFDAWQHKEPAHVTSALAQP